MYVHLLQGADNVLALPALPRRVVRAFLLDGGTAVNVVMSAGSVVLTLPRRDADVPDQVVALVLAR